MLKRLVFLFGLVLMAQAAPAQQAGIGAWENKALSTLNWIESQKGLSWYYNWRTDQMQTRGGQRRSVEFVPMIHNASNVNDRIRSGRKVRTLLGFNEPDGRGGKHQAGMTVAEAVALWPKLEARGLRLGSPATTQFGTLGPDSWQGRFMREVERRGLRVDFMAVHYYSPDGDVRAFRNWLIAVHKAYKRPIWVTEFALIDWNRPGRATYEANAVFAQKAIRMMEDLPFVERHAWFAANPYPWKGKAPQINLVDHNMRPTSLGKVFTDLVASRAPEQIASAE
ncbi:Glycosyl hydrolase catalytic core [Roseivivax lentus]|uniref:Glycosyl hydrolase catalytic core n=1 Tax=Roseivivax lentus TaxID=633194 RepID=A0A1N7N9D4_9RHOB|nr:glycosyl hydrolase [Roseivivax lentus]SIS94983.1 Glycosyl hydrolase catalytic core [Roseivivax lentus]